MLDTIYEIAKALGPASQKYSAALTAGPSNEHCEQIKASYLAQFKSLDTETLAKRVSAFMRWAIFRASSLSAEVAVLQPSAEAMIMFFTQVAKGRSNGSS